jgi:hypothetical protein
MHKSYPQVCAQNRNAVLTSTFVLTLDMVLYAGAYKSQEIL